jgi:membrane associated rhomboid family serine protease
MTEFRPGSFQILPVVIKNLLIINGLAFLAQLTIDGLGSSTELLPRTGQMADLFALHHLLSPLFKPWQLFTYLFMHGSIGHIASNMFALWMFGSVLENLWGPKRFLMFYLICGIGAAVLHLGALWYESMPILADFQNFKIHPTPQNFYDFFRQHPSLFVNTEVVSSFTNQWKTDPTNSQYTVEAIKAITDFTNTSISGTTMGASGAVFGCLAAFGFLFPNNYIYLYFLVPIKVKWAITAYMLIELYSTWRNTAGDNVAHIAHLGGALVGFLLVYFWNRTNRRQFY